MMIVLSPHWFGLDWHMCSSRQSTRSLTVMAVSVGCLSHCLLSTGASSSIRCSTSVLAFRREQQEYYTRLAAVRSDGDWEGWTRFFLKCVYEAADDGVRVAQALHARVGDDRSRIIAHHRSTVAAVQLLDRLPANPVVTVPNATKLLGLTAPPTRKAIDLLEGLGVLREITGKRRGRAYAYHEYLQVLTGDEA